MWQHFLKGRGTLLKKYIKNFLLCVLAVLTIAVLPMSASADDDLVTAQANEPEFQVTSKTLWVGGAGYTFKLQNINENDYTIYYSIADKDMATINYRTGYAKGINVGDTAATTIYAILIHNETGEVTVIEAPLYIKEKAADIEITNKEDAEVAFLAGDKMDFDFLMYNKAGQATDTRCKYVTDYAIWTSSNPAVATVNKTTGLVTAKSAGTATITVGAYVYENGSGKCSASDSITVYVVDDAAVKPTATPTVKPTAKPTATPTAKPTAKPTATPTAEPTVKPTATPTTKPQATATPTVAPGVLMISAEQKTINTIVVKFSRDVSDELTKNNTKVRNSNKIVQAIRGITFSEDGTEAEIYFWNTLDNDKDFVVQYDGHEVSFESSDGIVASVVVESKEVVNLVETPVEIKLYDRNGIDLTTSSALANLYFDCDNGYFNSIDRSIMLLVTGSEAKLTVTYTSPKFDSNTGTYPTCVGTGYFVSVEPRPVMFTELEVNIGSKVDYSTPVRTIAVGDTTTFVYARAHYTDESIKKTEMGAGGLTFKSTDVNKLLVNEANGYIVPITPGYAQILVYDGEMVVGEYEIQITEAKKLSKITLSKSTIRLSKNLSEDTETIRVIAYDQYGEEFDVSGYLTVEQMNTGNGDIVNISGCVDGDTITLNGGMFTKEGTYQYKVSCLDYSQMFAVSVATAGTAASHQIVTSDVIVDAACKSGKDIDKTITVKLFSYDRSGNKVGIINGSSTFSTMKYGYTITRSGEVEASEATPFPADGIINFNVTYTEGAHVKKAKAGSYIVKVYLSQDGTGKTSTLAYKAFEIIDSQEPPVIELKTVKISSHLINSNNDIMECFTVNGESINSTNNLTKYQLASIDSMYVEPTLWVKSITLYETFSAYGGTYVLEHTSKLDAIITAY